MGITYKVLKNNNRYITTSDLREKFGKYNLIFKIERAKRKLRQDNLLIFDTSSQSLRSLVFRFLKTRAGQIERGEFIPSLQNILSTSNKIKKLYESNNFTKTSITQAVRAWIKGNENLSFQNITELKDFFLSKSILIQKYEKLPTSDFKFNEKNLDLIQNTSIKSSLLRHFDALVKNNYPINAFLPQYLIFDKDGNKLSVNVDLFYNHLGKKLLIQNPRASMLQIRGSQSEKISMSYIIKNLIDVLKENKKLIELPKSNYFSNRVQEVFDNYIKNNLNQPINPHPDILSYFLSFVSKGEDIPIAIEIPVWKKLAEKKFYYGHIDLILVKKNIIFICDYKPNEYEVYRSLPQICAYGVMLKGLFQDINKDNDYEVKCVSFTRHNAWIFDYDIINNEILRFIRELNSIRKEPLMSIRLKGMDKPTPLYVDILMLIK